MKRPPNRATILTMRIRLPFIVLALAVLLVGHQLVYLATYGRRGIERALASVGHDGYWLMIGGVVSLALVVGLYLSLRRWLTLRTQLRELGGSERRRTNIDWALCRAMVIRLIPRLALTALVIFFVQENLEHYLHHAGHVPGLGALVGPDYVATLPIFLAVSVVVATVAALLRLGLAALERLVAGSAPRRPDRDIPRPAGRYLPLHPCSRSTPDLGRAPPAVA